MPETSTYAFLYAYGATAPRAGRKMRLGRAHATACGPPCTTS